MESLQKNSSENKTSNNHTNGRACSFRCAYDWPTLDACGNAMCVGFGRCSRIMELEGELSLGRPDGRPLARRPADETPEPGQDDRCRQLSEQTLPLFGVGGCELRGLLLGLLADDIADIALTVAQEVRR